MNHLEAKSRVMQLMPDMPGWPVHWNTATGPAPPWIVVRLLNAGIALNEAVNVTCRVWELDIRVVGADEDGVNIACERLQDAFDGRHPDGMAALVPYRDSGVYASELTDPRTGCAYVMRVLSWRGGA